MKADRAGINMRFVDGYAQKLPFPTLGSTSS
jgi:hypothetical protein